jgi:glycosyltransferase involved in cell wall biosynthesis
VFVQTYKNWTIYYINDKSTDRTGQLVEEYVKKRGMKNKCTIVHNQKNMGAMANWYTSVHLQSPHKVIVSLDGDDFLHDAKVLEKLANVYKDPSVWMTYGSHNFYPSGKLGIRNGSISKKTQKNRLFRQKSWVTSHLRTFYAGLFQKVKKEDFMYEGEFFKTTCDFAIMFPMLEMASKGHIKHIKDILYDYNVSNPIRDCVAKRQLQAKMEHHIRSKPKYAPLNKLF